MSRSPFGDSAAKSRARKISSAPATTPAQSKKAPPSKKPKAPASPEQKISGTIVRVRHVSADGESAILSLRTAGGDVIALKGKVGCQLVEGKRIHCMARETVHEKYGRQFVTDLIQEELPQTDEGVIMYLANEVEGIGPEMAQRLVAHFGAAGIFSVIETSPERLAEVDGVGAKRIEAIKASWDSNALLRSLLSGLGSFGITANKAMRIIDRFGGDALSVVRENPFELTCIRGIGFKTADAIALSVGLPRNSIYRLQGAIVHLIEETEGNGHTAIIRSALVESALKLTALDSSHTDQVESVLDEMIKRREIHERRINGHRCISLAHSVYFEKIIARRIRELIERGDVDPVLAERAAKAAEALGDADQIDAVRKAFLNPVSIITGRPGCGKTTVTRFIIETAKSEGADVRIDEALASKLNVRLCAPTGKAARRIKEATGYAGETIHNMLVFTPNGFLHNRRNPLKGDIFIMDEGSMADNEISAAFFSAVPDGARVILVGDADQLPSVGAGNVLKDLINSDRIAVSRLYTPHRTAADSEIIVNAHHIINGRQNEIDLKGAKDFRFDAADEDDEIVTKLMAEYAFYGERFGFENVQVLTARRGTDCGIQKLNEHLRRIANPPAPGKKSMDVAKRVLRTGDRVMQTKNSKRLDISNGEIGTITGFDFETKTTFVQFGDRTVAMNKFEANELELANASTIHSSQGSEFPVVLIVMSKAHKFMLNRELFYTAVTRGKKMVHIIGRPDCVRTAIWKVGSNRLTGLVKEIHEEMPIKTVLTAPILRTAASGVSDYPPSTSGQSADKPAFTSQQPAPPPAPVVRGSDSDDGVVKARVVGSLSDLLSLSSRTRK